MGSLLILYIGFSTYDRIEKYGAYIVFISKYSSIAAMKNFLADRRLTSSSPLPPPPTPSGASTDHP